MVEKDCWGPDELYHYGRKGMKWGQHIFGTVKTAKTNRKRKKNLEKARQARAEKQKAQAERQKKIANNQLSYKEMTDDELSKAINRARLEQTYADLHPKQVSNGKKFATRVANNMLVPAAEDVGKQLMKSGMVYVVNRALDLDDAYKVHTNNKKKS